MTTTRRAVPPIPEYLSTYVVQQDSSLYTWIDQASWRFILKLSQDFFKKYAHRSYLDGLRETGISTERIPLIGEMNECLGEFGWQAVAVSGFIPPGVFMEFLSLGILPIACDMRKIENLAYTPAPDIVHEAAGHAPIIADPAFSAYLRNYGELSRKAIFSSQDMDVYNAIRFLSDTKEDPASSEASIREADERLDKACASVKYDSEATQLSRMAWWTFEYGLVGDIANPKIYGAGLLSSMSESFHCLGPDVKKIPFSLDCIHQTYDITKPQPQIYVARDFQQLSDALEEMSKDMAYKKGGLFGVEQAKKAATVTTTELSSGVQVSGVLADSIERQGQPAYLMYKGPTQISFHDQQLDGQGADYHREGFGTPVGELHDGFLSEALDEAALWKAGFSAAGASPKMGTLKFKSGVEVTGIYKNIIRRDGKTLLIAFTDCTVKLGDRILFDPSWGTFDMACGANVRSVFGGAADRKRFLADTGGFHQDPKLPKTNLTPANRGLNEFYQRVRKVREKQASALTTDGVSELKAIVEKLDREFPQDWLLRYEILELAQESSTLAELAKDLRSRLEQIAKQDSTPGRPHAELIQRGLAVL
jgi:phenylalanine-4-hydroxylase